MGRQTRTKTSTAANAISCERTDCGGLLSLPMGPRAHSRVVSAIQPLLRVPRTEHGETKSKVHINTPGIHCQIIIHKDPRVSLYPRCDALMRRIGRTYPIPHTDKLATGMRGSYNHGQTNHFRGGATRRGLIKKALQEPTCKAYSFFCFKQNLKTFLFNKYPWHRCRNFR